MIRVPTAIVIGGGIAGAATAMALRKVGIDSTVYEAHSTRADGIGAFLTPQRIYRAFVGRLHRLSGLNEGASASPDAATDYAQYVRRKTRRLTQKHAWKGDFNQHVHRGAMLLSTIIKLWATLSWFKKKG